MSLWLSRGSWPILWGRLWGGLRVLAHMHVTVPVAQRPLSTHAVTSYMGLQSRRVASVSSFDILFRLLALVYDIAATPLSSYHSSAISLP